jgi:prolyl-tRNA editing enzyme YbaK/EbsC (Cys-tRNA(Pro) deacylase)
MSKMSAFDKLKSFLDENNISYEFKEHEEVRTSEEAAKARGEDIKIGAKAMILKCDDRFVMFVLSAAKKIDSKRAKEILNVKSMRFATPEEVTQLTGCVPGGVPPFANIFGLDLLLDKTIVANEFMAFNAGERTKSLKLKTKDYLSLLKPRVEDFSI